MRKKEQAEKPLQERTLREKILREAAVRYEGQPEYLWKTNPDCAVLRHGDNGKWYALFMHVEQKKLGLSGDGGIDIVNLKCDPALAGSLRASGAVLPAYHMNKEKWISVPLDSSVSEEQILSLLDLSYELTASSGKQYGPAGGREWLIPANPHYYDVEAAFRRSDTIFWKQTSNVAVGDIVYIYMGAPVSSVLYRCRAEETDILRGQEGKVRECGRRSREMTLLLLQRIPEGQVGREKLREHGVHAVRSARRMPPSLAREIEAMLSLVSSFSGVCYNRPR